MLPVLLLLTLAFAILTWRDLHKGLFVLVAVLPSYLLRTEILGIPTTLLELLVVTFLVVWSVKRETCNVKRKACCQFATRYTIHVSRFTLPIILLLLAATLSIAISPNFVAALGVWKSYFVEPILLFFVIRYELTTTKKASTKGSPDTFMLVRMFQALGLSAIVLSLFAIAQWLTGAGLPIPWDIERRVTSVFDYPNALGLFLGPIVVIALLSIKYAGRLSRFWFTTAVLSLVAIVLAQSEAAIVSILAVLSIVGLLHVKTRYPTAVGILVVILVVLLSPWRAVVIDKLTLQDYSGQVRLSQWGETVDMLGDHWLLGVGLSGYPTALEPYHQATHIEIFQYPHNIILNIWVELGLLGLVAFLLLVYSVKREACSVLSIRSTLHAPQLLAFLALLQMTIHGLVDVPYFKNDLAILTWILLAIVYTYARPTTPTTS